MKIPPPQYSAWLHRDMRSEGVAPGGSSDHSSDAPSGRLEAGLFLVIVALPLVFTPFTASPFVDPKLVILLGGALLIALAGIRGDRRLGIAALAWVAALLASALAGLDPWWSILGPEDQGTGVLALGASAYLLYAGSGVSNDLRRRIPTWLFWTAVAVSGVTVVGRFVDFGGATWSVRSISSTIGHRVFVGGFIAAGMIAATTLGRSPRRTLGLLLVGSALAVSSARAAWVGAALGLLVVVLHDRRLWRRVGRVFVTIAIALASWTLATPLLPTSSVGYSAAQRFAQLGRGFGSGARPGLAREPQGFRPRSNPRFRPGNGMERLPPIRHCVGASTRRQGLHRRA